MLSGLLRAAGRGGRSAALTVLLALVVALPAAAKPAVWAVPSLVRVERNAPAASSAMASLEAARGETELFQIVVRADDEELKEVSIGVGDLKGPGGAVIPARNHVLYREHYVAIGETATPGGKPGLYADALIPFRDPTTGRAPGRAELKAQDVTVPAKASQPFWVDIAVPAGATPGAYRGTWWARAGGRRLGGGRWSSRCGTWRSRRRRPCARRSTSGTTIRWPRTRRCSPRR